MWRMLWKYDLTNTSMEWVYSSKWGNLTSFSQNDICKGYEMEKWYFDAGVFLFFAPNTNFIDQIKGKGLAKIKLCW